MCKIFVFDYVNYGKESFVKIFLDYYFFYLRIYMYNVFNDWYG